MPGPGKASTAPATTPDNDVGVVTPRVVPSMSDDQIRAELRRAFLADAEDFATEFRYRKEYPTKDLASFKAMLEQWWTPKSDAFRVRFTKLVNQVVDDVGPKLFAYYKRADDPLHVIASSTPHPAAKNVAQGSDPVHLFNGDFRYSTVDLHLNGAGMDFVFARTYSQLAGYSGPLGEKWDHSYNLWIRLDDSADSLHRSNGALAEETYRRHASFSYWVPPIGVHGIVVEDAEGFTFRRRDGSSITYRPQPGVAASVYLATSIADRFGNALTLDYTEGLLTSVLVNHADRRVEFAYDSRRRITELRDFTGRTWHFTYDAEADLVAVTMPATQARPRRSTTRYQYLGASFDPPQLAHHLDSITDADGRVYLANSYGTDPGLLSYRRVVTQRQGNGESHFEYSEVVEVFDVPYAEHERPTCQTVVTERDGHQTRQLFNNRGNMLMHEEVGRVGGVPKLLTRHYRYNRDGSLVGVMSPLGSLTQAVWGRDAYERRFPVQDGARPEQDPHLSAQERLAFGNLLTVVKRGRRHSIGSLSSTGLWSQSAFPDVLGADAEDIIQKFTYEANASQLLTSSDPRVTRSADPVAPEDAEYQRRLTHYEYSSAGAAAVQLQAVHQPTPTQPDGQPAAPVTTRFESYDDHGRVLAIVAPNGLRTVNEYEPSTAGVRGGFLVGHTIDPAGFDLHQGIRRDDLGRAVGVSRPSAVDAGDGRFVSSVRYDERSQMIEQVSTPPHAVRTRNYYDRSGHLVRSELALSDADGVPNGTFVTQNRYDDEGHVVRQQIGDAAGSSTKTRRIRYDAAARPVVHLDASGRIGLLRYNARSLVAAVVEDLGGVHAVTRRYYDADGRLERVVDPRGATTRFSYDAVGNVIEVADAVGNRLVRHVDKLGKPLVECLFERRGDDSFVLVYRRELGYDELGRITTASAGRFAEPAPVGAADVQDAFRNSGPGRLLRLRYFRDTLGNVVKAVDQGGREFVAQFDALGRLTARTDPLGNQVRLRYDKEGNITRVDHKEVTPAPGVGGPVTEQWFAEGFTFDELNRTTSHRTAAGTTAVRYDSRGLATAVTDPAGDRTEHVFDVFSRRVETRHLLGASGPSQTLRTSFAYNLDDALVRQTDPRGNVTSFEYDTAGRLQRTVLADGTSDVYTYDRGGTITTYRDRNGLVRNLEWDALRRNTGTSVDQGTVPPGDTAPGTLHTHFDYDALGRITSAGTDFVSSRFRYDSIGLLQESVTFGAQSGVDPTREFVLSRELSDTGAVTALTYPSGRRLTFKRDPLDRIEEVAQTALGADYPGAPGSPEQRVVASVEYEGLRPRRIVRGNGITTTYGYDFCGRAADLEHRLGSTQILHQQFLYDALGNVHQQAEKAGQATLLRRASYDALSRLQAVGEGTASVLPDLSDVTPATSPVSDPIPLRQAELDAHLAPPPAPSHSYSYDASGNRTASLTETGQHTYQVDEVDRYTSVDGRVRVHDANGNRSEDSGFTYRYDFRDQLVLMRDKSTGVETHLLRDAFGRVCVERSGGDEQILLYDGHHPVETYGPSGLSRSIVSSGQDDHYLLTSSGGNEGYLLTDLRRSVRAVFDDTNLRGRYTYDEFGRLLAPPAVGDDNLFFFASARRAGSSEAYQFDYRTYDPADGRFLQRDPRGFTDGTNLYTFARNNPLSLSDPLGTESRLEHPPIAGKLGAELAFRNPAGFTLAVPDNFDRGKLRAYRERIQDPLDRGVGIRSRPEGLKTSTEDIRARFRSLQEEFRASLPADRPTGTQVDHTVELQHIIRDRPDQFAPGADRVRPQDHRLQDAHLNASQGSRAQKVKARQVDDGAPLDTSAGGVARERDVNKFWNREGFRTGMRYFGYYNMIGGTFSALTSVGSSIRSGDFTSAGVSTSAYLGGSFTLGGIAAESSALISAGRWLGAPAAVVSSGVIGVRIGHNLYQNYVNKRMFLDAGSWVEEHTGSRILGAGAAAATAVGDAAVHVPEAAYDYVKDNVTLDPDQIDWGRTLEPWKWF